MSSDRTCARCGGPLGRRPALSRYSDARVCDACGVAEALEVALAHIKG